jgi:hypothetical protein
LKRSSDTKHGFTTRDTRKWAHDYARKLQLKCPENFSTNLTAGKDWLAGFLNKVTLTESQVKKNFSVLFSSIKQMINIEYFLQNFDLPKFSCLTDGENELLLCWKSFNLSQKLRQGFQLDNQVAKEKRQSSLKKTVKQRLEEEQMACDDCFNV